MSQEQFKTLRAAVEANFEQFKIDADKFEKGNKAAGTRVRKAGMEITKQMKEIRKVVSDIKNEG